MLTLSKIKLLRTIGSSSDVESRWARRTKWRTRVRTACWRQVYGHDIKYFWHNDCIYWTRECMYITLNPQDPLGVTSPHNLHSCEMRHATGWRLFVYGKRYNGNIDLALKMRQPQIKQKTRLEEAGGAGKGGGETLMI